MMVSPVDPVRPAECRAAAEGGGELLRPPDPPHPLSTGCGQYRIAPGARPRRVRRDARGDLVGEVLVVPVGRGVPAAAGTGGDLEGRRPDPQEAATPAEFVAVMRRYRAWVGSPSYAQMQFYCGGVCSAAGFRAALTDCRLPCLPLLSAFITACGGGEAEYRRWVAAWQRLNGPSFLTG